MIIAHKDRVSAAAGLLIAGLASLAASSWLGTSDGLFAHIAATGLVFILAASSLFAGSVRLVPAYTGAARSITLRSGLLVQRLVLLSVTLIWLGLAAAILVEARRHFEKTSYGETDQVLVLTALLPLLFLCASGWSFWILWKDIRGQQASAPPGWTARRGRAGVAILWFALAGGAVAAELRWPPRIWFLLQGYDVRTTTALGIELDREDDHDPGGAYIEYEFLGLGKDLVSCRRRVWDGVDHSLSEVLSIEDCTPRTRFVHLLDRRCFKMNWALHRWKSHYSFLDEAVRAGGVTREKASRKVRLELPARALDHSPVTVTLARGTSPTYWLWRIEEIHDPDSPAIWSIWANMHLEPTDRRVLAARKVDSRHSLATVFSATKEDMGKRVITWSRECPALRDIAHLRDVL